MSMGTSEEDDNEGYDDDDDGKSTIISTQFICYPHRI